MVDDKTPTILNQVDKIGLDFQKTFGSKFDSIIILVKTTILVNFCKFHFFPGERVVGVGAACEIDFTLTKMAFL